MLNLLINEYSVKIWGCQWKTAIIPFVRSTFKRPKMGLTKSKVRIYLVKQQISPIHLIHLRRNWIDHSYVALITYVGTYVGTWDLLASLLILLSGIWSPGMILPCVFMKLALWLNCCLQYITQYACFDAFITEFRCNNIPWEKCDDKTHHYNWLSTMHSLNLL